MNTHLENNPPNHSQYREKRRSLVSGAIVLHLAENNLDGDVFGSGAEEYAQYISERDESGSYHSVVDPHEVVQIMPYEWEAFHEDTGGNGWSLGLAFATGVHEWQKLPTDEVDAVLANGALEARAMAIWVEETMGIVIPAQRITAKEYRARKPGFVALADLKPDDGIGPGATFPWKDFLDQFEMWGIEDPAVVQSEDDDPTMELECADLASPAPVDVDPSQPLLPVTPGTFSLAMDDVDELYRAYSGNRPTSELRRTLARDLAQRIFAGGEDPQDFLSDLHGELSAQNEVE